MCVCVPPKSKKKKFFLFRSAQRLTTGIYSCSSLPRPSASSHTATAIHDSISVLEALRFGAPNNFLAAGVFCRAELRVGNP